VVSFDCAGRIKPQEIFRSFFEGFRRNGVSLFEHDMNTKLVYCVVAGAFLFAGAALADTKSPVIGAYFKVEQAVVNQDLNAVKAAASDLAQKAQMANNETILKDANDLAKTESIDQVRQVFRTLSDDTLHLIQTGEGSQETAGSASGTQCMQTTHQTSCMGSTTLSCGMMSMSSSCGMMDVRRRSMSLGGCLGMGG
jgi:hypothetical protein